MSQTLFKKKDETSGEESTDWESIAIIAAVTTIVGFVVQFGLKALFRKLGWE